MLQVSHPCPTDMKAVVASPESQDLVHKVVTKQWDKAGVEAVSDAGKP